MATPSDHVRGETPRPGAAITALPRISIIAPMLNEADHVESFVDDIAAQDYTGELEVIIADGGSTDGSPARLREAAARAEIDVAIVPNPAVYVSPGLNACIKRATGDLLVRLDCHTRYPPDYLRRSALASIETGAWHVGGLLVPRGRTLVERAVASAMDSPFGGTQWTRWGGSSERIEVDAVWCGAYRPEAFERAGLFDEALVRNQDDEFAFRLRQSGGRIVLDPRIRAYYVPRGSLVAVWRQYHEFGVWKVPVMLKHRQIMSARSLAPIGFVASLLVLGLAGTRSARARTILGVEIATYAASAVVFGTASIRTHEEDRRLLPLVVAIFPIMHVAYGAGVLRGCLRALRRR